MSPKCETDMRTAVSASAPACIATASDLRANLLQGAKAACCTNGQPSYEDSEYQGNFPIPTCSDGPCSGEGFSYAGGGAYESPNPLSCCDMENLGQFKYNPQDGSGKYWPWPNDKHFPEFLEGTGQPCDPEAVRFRCKLGGHVSGVWCIDGGGGGGGSSSSSCSGSTRSTSSARCRMWCAERQC
jgi:hypothetical protein